MITFKKYTMKHTSLLAMGFVLAGGAAQAQSLEDALKQTQIHGNVGVDDFTYANSGHTPDTTNAFAVGGNVVVHTGAFEGFSVGVGGYTGQSLGLYSRNPEHDDSKELASKYHSEQSIREAYLQYTNNWLEVRGGRQMINTPYANQDWYTFNPRAFMGFAGTANIIGGHNDIADSAPISLTTNNATLSVFAARMFSVDGRTVSGFGTGNRFLDHSNGMLSFGTHYQNKFGDTSLTLQGWYYDFYGLGQLFYGQADVSQPVSPNNVLFGSFQMTHEGDSGSGHSAYGHVDGHVYGGRLGMTFGRDNVAAIGDFMPVSYGSYRHGSIIHPYNDNSGTIFTDTMQTGLEDFGPGWALGVQGNIFVWGGRLQISPSYVEYKIDYGFGGNVFTYDGPYGFPVGTPIRNEHVHVLDSNFKFDLSDWLKGLSFDWDSDAAFSDNGKEPGQHYSNPYFSSRASLKYSF